MSQLRGANKELRKLLAEIEAAGATVAYTRSRHWQVLVDGKVVAVVSRNPRAHRRIRADLRRAGLNNIRVPR